MIKKIRTALTKPYLIREFAKNKANLLAYRLRSTRALMPGIIYFVVNSSCNMRCIMCDVGQGQKRSQFYRNLIARDSEMGFENFRKVIRDVRRFKPDIVFSSTEPLMYSRIIEAVKEVKQNGLRCRLTTNGYLLSTYADELAESGLDEIIVSVDGPPAVHDKIRGVKGAYKKLHAGLVELGAAKKRLGKSKPYVRINFTITEHNYDKIIRTIDCLKGLQIFQITINHMNFVTPKMSSLHNRLHPRFRATPSCMSTTDIGRIDAVMLHKELEDIKSRFPGGLVSIVPDLTLDEIKQYYGSPIKTIGRLGKCTVPWRVAQVCVNGDVIPLTRCMNAVMGNVFNDKFEKVWNGKRYRELRALLLKYKSLPACSRCCGVF